MKLPWKVIDRILILNPSGYRLLLKLKRFHILSTLPYLDATWSVKANNCKYMEYLLQNGRIVRDAKKATNIASKNNYIRCLVFLLRLYSKVSHKAMYSAVRNNNVEALKLLVNNIDSNGMPYCDIKYNRECFKLAIESGHLDMVKYLIELDFYIPSNLIHYLNSNGYFNVIKLYIEHQIKQNGLSSIDFSYCHNSVEAAILHNNINFIKFLIKIGYTLSTKKLSILSAIQLNNLLRMGNLEMVEFLLETTEPLKPDITFDDYSIYLDDYLNVNNIIFNADTFKIAKKYNYKNILDVLLSKCITINEVAIEFVNFELYNKYCIETKTERALSMMRFS